MILLNKAENEICVNLLLLLHNHKAGISLLAYKLSKFNKITQLHYTISRKF